MDSWTYLSSLREHEARTALAKCDFWTKLLTKAKVERVSAQVRQLTVTATNSLTTQRDNIEFLLTRTQQLTESQTRLEEGQAKLEHKVNEGFKTINQRFIDLIQLLNEKLK